MIAHGVVAILLGLAVVIALLCSLGLLVMRDPWQKLHFSAPIVTLSMASIIVAVWVDEPDWQGRIKVLLIGAVLFAMNSVLTHATARAIRIREMGHWKIEPAELKHSISETDAADGGAS